MCVRVCVFAISVVHLNGFYGICSIIHVLHVQCFVPCVCATVCVCMDSHYGLIFVYYIVLYYVVLLCIRCVGILSVLH